MRSNGESEGIVNSVGIGEAEGKKQERGRIEVGGGEERGEGFYNQ